MNILIVCVLAAGVAALVGFAVWALMAARIQAERSSTSRERELSQIVLPLKAAIDKYMEDARRSQEKANVLEVRMESHMKALESAAERFNAGSTNFVNAITGGNKVAGNWGEAVLGQLLEDCGLRRDVNYIAQEGGTGNIPDFQVFDAASRKILVIDSKVSWKKYKEMSESADPAVRERALEEHVESIRRQIENLAGKRYHENPNPPREGFAYLPFSAMFVPSDAALWEAVKKDPTLPAQAYRKGVVLVTPTSLYGFMRLIHEGWALYNTQRNQEAIAHEAELVVERIDALFRHLEDADDACAKARERIAAAMKCAAAEGSCIRGPALKILSLHNKTKKPLRSKAMAGGLAVFCAAVSSGAVKVGAPFGDHMVLQRDRPVPVWGTADAGEKVRVAFAGQAKETVADANGRWRVNLEPMPASEEGRTLTAGNAAFRDVLVGEVWLCSGQSNMSLKLFDRNFGIGANLGHETDGYFDAMIVNEPAVRWAGVDHCYDVVERETFDKPLAWHPFVPGEASFRCSAVAFHYAVILRQALRVPVGVVVSAWGGSSIQPWISPDGFRSVKGLGKYADMKLAMSFDPPVSDAEDLRNPGAAKKPKKGSPYPKQARILWNAMIRPLVPFAFRGAIWYQGEANLSDGPAYADYLHALWNGWSKAFENPELSFYLAEIAPWGYYGNGAVNLQLRPAQARFAAENPHAGLAPTSDIGELDNIHPCRKRTVAMRLAALALNRDYGRTDIACDAPRFKAASVVTGGVVRVSFEHAGDHWLMCGKAPEGMFELAGADGTFRPARAAYGKTTVDLSAADVPEPKQVRFLWNWQMPGKLLNSSGLPLLPFSAEVR